MPDYTLKEGSKPARFVEIAKPDANGFSREVPMSELPNDMQFGNGASWARDDGPLGRVFNVVRHRGKGPKIVSISLEGFARTTPKRPIPTAVRKALRDKACVVLGVTADQVDHKVGALDADHPDATSTRDFQPMKTCVNTAKRQHCRECQDTKTRFDARRLGYPMPQWRGGEKYAGSCVGCFWHDPVEFRRHLKAVPAGAALPF